MRHSKFARAGIRKGFMQRHAQIKSNTSREFLPRMNLLCLRSSKFVRMSCPFPNLSQCC